MPYNINEPGLDKQMDFGIEVRLIDCRDSGFGFKELGYMWE